MIGVATSLASLSQRAVALRERWGVAAPDELTVHSFDSTYTCGGGEPPRGWCNWLIPGWLMLGQYPYTQPSRPGPTAEEGEAHLQAVLDAGVDAFLCLQDEVPPQDAERVWPEDGVPLAGSSSVRFPGRFARYRSVADRLAANAGRRLPVYLHHAIEDLNVPSDATTLRRLLDSLLTHYEQGGSAIYVHCWGGRGRAGTIGATVLSLMWPKLGGDMVLEIVQRGYDSRAGASAMPVPLQHSPQTEAQRDLVRRFARSVGIQSDLTELGMYG